MSNVGPALHAGWTRECVARVAANQQLPKFRRAYHRADCNESLNEARIGARRQIVVRDERPETVKKVWLPRRTEIVKHEYVRMYLFKFLPIGFFQRLLLR